MRAAITIVLFGRMHTRPEDVAPYEVGIDAVDRAPKSGALDEPVPPRLVSRTGNHSAGLEHAELRGELRLDPAGRFSGWRAGAGAIRPSSTRRC